MIQNKDGTTLLELIFGILISTIIIFGVYRAWRYFDVSTNREKYKAELQQDIISVANIIERDIRMAGCGLPGNGVAVDLNPTANDKIELYTNESGASTVLTQIAQPVHTEIKVKDASIFTVGGAVLITSSDTTIYRTIQHTGLCSTCDDTIVVTEQLNTTQPFLAGLSSAYPARKIKYEISTAGTGVSLIRTRNGASMRLGSKLDSIEVKPKDDNNNILTGSGKNASVITIVMGGYVGSGSSQVFLAESTDVNIRNK